MLIGYLESVCVFDHVRKCCFDFTGLEIVEWLFCENVMLCLASQGW
jgi:hypothetical protein